MLPEDWQFTSLRNILSVSPRNGYSPNCPDVPNGRWILSLGALGQDSLDISQKKPAPLNDPLVDKYLLAPGDFLVSRSNTPDKVGRIALFKGEIPNCSYPDLMMRFRVRDDCVDLEYLEQFLRSTYVTQQIRSSAAGTSHSMVKLNKASVERLPIILPPITEQKRIAKILSLWGYAFDLTERLIAAKQESRTWLMQQLLTGKRRLPGFGKPATEYHLLEGWDKVPISKQFKPVRRKNDKGVTRVLTASGEHGLVNQTEFFNRSVAGESLNDYFLLHQGEFAYNRSSMKGYPYGAIKRLDEYEEGVLSTLYICFAPASADCCSDYYKHLFEGGVLNRQLREIVSVGARAHGLLNVTVHDFFSLKVPCPPLEEQHKIAATIETADREISLLLAQLDALREQKRGLMQQLLTGKCRVKVAGAEVTT